MAANFLAFQIEKERFFASGEPNGGADQRCLAAKLDESYGGGTKYFDQDCKNHHACSLCMTPQLLKFTLRGLGQFFHPDEYPVETHFYMNTFIYNPTAFTLYFPGIRHSTVIYNFVTASFEVRRNRVIHLKTTTRWPYGNLRNVTIYNNQTENGKILGVNLKFTNVSIE